MKHLPILAFLLAAGMSVSAYGAPKQAVGVTPLPPPASAPTNAPVAPIVGPLAGQGPTLTSPVTAPGAPTVPGTPTRPGAPASPGAPGAPSTPPNIAAILQALMGATGGAGAPAANAANQPDPCSGAAPVAAQTVALPANLGLFMDDGSSTPSSSAPPELKPQNPATKSCEHGRIMMQVQMDRSFGNRIGDALPIVILIKADKGVLIDFSSLKQNVLGFSGSDFQVIPGQDIQLKAQPANKEKTVFVYQIVVPAQTFIMKPDIAFNLDLKYALDVKDGTKQPNWQILTTPDFVVTTSNTADNGSELQEGNVDKATVRSPWMMWFLVPAALFCIFWPAVRRFVLWLNRIRPGRKIPAEEVAWKVFRKVFNDSQDYGRMSPEFVKKIEAALRQYLNVKSETVQEMKFRLQGHAQLGTIIDVFTKLQAVHWARADRQFVLTDLAIDNLYADLKKLVPMPKNFL